MFFHFSLDSAPSNARAASCKMLLLVTFYTVRCRPVTHCTFSRPCHLQRLGTPVDGDRFNMISIGLLAKTFKPCARNQSRAQMKGLALATEFFVAARRLTSCSQFWFVL